MRLSQLLTAPNQLTLMRMVFLPFVVDATATLLRRAARGKRVWEAHREHYYQRAVRMDWPTRRVLAGEIALMVCSASVSAAANGARPLLIAGVVKGTYDILLLIKFQRVRPPEEAAAGTG